MYGIPADQRVSSGSLGWLRFDGAEDVVPFCRFDKDAVSIHLGMVETLALAYSSTQTRDDNALCNNEQGTNKMGLGSKISIMHQ